MDKTKFCKAFVDSVGDTLKAYATVEVKDRDGDIVRVKGMEFDHRPESPLKVFGTTHKYNSLPDGTIPVIGIVKSITKATRKIDGQEVPAVMFEMDWAKSVEGETESISPFAAKMKGLFAAGTLDSFSIGFEPLDVKPFKGGRYDITKSRCFEISACPLPVNKYATVLKALKSEIGDYVDADEILEARLIEMQKSIDGTDTVLKAILSRFDDLESAIVAKSEGAQPTGDRKSAPLDKEHAELAELIARLHKSLTK